MNKLESFAKWISAGNAADELPAVDSIKTEAIKDVVLTFRNNIHRALSLARFPSMMSLWGPDLSLRTSIESVNFFLPGFANFFPSSVTRIVFTSTRVIETNILNGLAVQLPRSGVPSVWM